MTSNDIINLRLQNQQLSDPSFINPIEVVRWMGAIQAQDYAGAKWALATRLKNPVEAEIDRAINAGEILRTHVLRPTWHFVLPDDIRWMLELTEPRISAYSAKHFRDLKLDNTVLKRTNKIIAKALERGRHLTKKEIGEELKNAGIDTSELRLTFITFRAELDQVICSGARRGKQFTYALFGERSPAAKSLKKVEALAELAKRYFRSRGPATVADFTWWSGLSPADAREAIELIRPDISSEKVGGETYFFMPSDLKRIKAPKVLFLPAWDEYTVAYKDRRLVVDPQFEKDSGHGVFNSNIIINGRIKGAWRRELKDDTVVIKTQLFASPAKTMLKNLNATAKLYAGFVGKKLFD